MAQSVKPLIQKSEDLSSATRAQVKMPDGVECTYNPSTEQTTKISGLACQPVYSLSLYSLQFFIFIALICLECVCVFLCVQVCMHVMVCMWQSEDSLRQLALFFHHVDCKDNSGSQPWWQACLLIEPSFQPCNLLFPKHLHFLLLFLSRVLVTGFSCLLRDHSICWVTKEVRPIVIFLSPIHGPPCSLLQLLSACF